MPESIRLKTILKAKQVEQGDFKLQDPYAGRFTITRILGHKEEMPGSS
jgi:hypothetical protein